MNWFCMIIYPSDGVSDFSFQIKEASVDIILSALEVIKELNTLGEFVSFETLDKFSASYPGSNLIDKIFKDILGSISQSCSLEDFVHCTGFESVNDVIKNDLEQELWDRKKAQINIKYLPFIDFIDNTKKNSIFDRARFEELAEEVDSRWESFRTSQPPQWTPAQKDKDEWSIKWMSCKKNWEKFKDCIRNAPSIRYFPENETDRRIEFLKFANRYLQAFKSLSAVELDLFALESINSFIDLCMSGWDAGIRQLQELVSKDVAKDPTIIAQIAARNVRRRIVETALREILKEIPEAITNPHYQNAGRQASHRLLFLGYKNSELGVGERTLAGSIASELKIKSYEILEERYSFEIVNELIDIYKSMSFQDKKKVVDSFLSWYQDAVLANESLLIDNCEELYSICVNLKNWALESSLSQESYETLGKLCISLQNVGISPSFSSLPQDVLIFQQIQQIAPLNIRKLKLFEALSLSKEGSTLIRSLLDERKASLPDESFSELESLIETLERSQDKESQNLYFTRLKQRVFETSQAFEHLRASFNVSLLEKKLIHNQKLSQFGAYFWSVQSKILKIDYESLVTSPILAALSQEPLSSDCTEIILESVSDAIKNIEELHNTNPDSWRDLKQLVASGNLEAVLEKIASRKFDPLERLESAVFFNNADHLLELFSTYRFSDDEIADYFIRAIKKGHTESVIVFLNSSTVLPSDLLWEACEVAITHNHPMVLEILLRSRAYPKDALTSILDNAVQLNNLEIFCVILEIGVFSEQTINELISFLSYNGLLEFLSFCLKKLSISYFIKNTCLKIAAKEGNLTVVLFWLHKSNFFTKEEDEACLEALKKNHKAIVEVFLNRKSLSVEASAKCLAQIINWDREDLITLLLDSVNFLPTNLIDAIIEIANIGNFNFFKIFHEKFPDIIFEELACIPAAEAGQLEFLSLLFENFTVPDDCKKVCLQEAAKHGHLNLVLYLLENGSISEESRGAAVIEAASFDEKLEVVKALLLNGPITDSARDEAIRRAVFTSRNSLLILRFLFENASDEYRGRTLVKNVKMGSALVVEELLKGRAIPENYMQEARHENDNRKSIFGKMKL